MSFESNHSQDHLSLREAALERQLKEIETWADTQGAGIDAGIKETVALCNLLGLPTAQSCEGHFGDSARHGFPAPWIRVSAPNEPELRHAHEAETYQRIAKKYGVTVEAVRRARNESAWVEAQKLLANEEETEEYRAWSLENEKLLTMASAMLNEFYQSHSTEEDSRLIADAHSSGFDIHNGGKFYIPIADAERMRTELTAAEQESLPNIHKACQEEMRVFTEFLKQKYFAEN